MVYLSIRVHRIIAQDKNALDSETGRHSHVILNRTLHTGEVSTVYHWPFPKRLLDKN